MPIDYRNLLHNFIYVKFTLQNILPREFQIEISNFSSIFHFDIYSNVDFKFYTIWYAYFWPQAFMQK